MQNSEALAVAEGALVRGTSELFRPYGIRRVRKVKNGIVKVEFSPSVFLPPYWSENKLLKIEETERVANRRWSGPRGTRRGRG